MNALESGTMKPDMEIISAAQREFEGQIKAINGTVSMYAVIQSL